MFETLPAWLLVTMSVGIVIGGVSLAAKLGALLIRDYLASRPHGSWMPPAVEIADTRGAPPQNQRRFSLTKDRTLWLPRWLDVWWMLNNAHRDYDSWFRPGLYEWLKKLLFNLRNPLHNFFFFVVGICDQDFTRYGFQPDGVWGSTWNLCYIKNEAGKIGWPFVSYKGSRFEWYLGWREIGNFGVALRRSNG